MSPRFVHALVLALGVMASGCHEFEIVNGKTPLDARAPGFDDKLHSAVIGDIVEVDQPVALNAVCPQSWAKIERRVTFVDGLINVLAAVTAVGGVYKADSVSVTCARPASPPDAPAAAASAPPLQPAAM